MDLLSSKWLRTLIWLFLATLCAIFMVEGYLFLSPILWILIGFFCLFNAYIEFMVSAIFISPGPVKNSLESTEWKSHFVELESVTTHIQTFQQEQVAPLIVFIHGWRGSSASVQDRAQWFVKKGWHVVICELPGHGKSTPLRRWNALTAVKHMKFHIKHLDDFIEPQYVSHFFFYGHSMGGYISTRLSINEGNIPFNLPLSGLILESPLMLYSKILEDICNQLKIPSFVRTLHLRRVFRDVKTMHPSITAHTLEQFDIPQWGVPSVPTLCLQAMTDTRLGRDHYDALVNTSSKDTLLTHHLIESLSHSGAKTNDEREAHLLNWLETIDSLSIR